MLIEEKPLKHWLDNFYGYGSWHARVWFISYEESGGDVPEDVADRINYFYKTHTKPTPALCDVRELYRNVDLRIDGPKADLFDTLHDYRFGPNAIHNTVWKNLISFLHGYQDRSLPDLIEYQKTLFATPTGHNEALIRLYPLPGSSSHAWYYSWLDLPHLPFLKRRTLYQEHVYERRMHTILTNIRLHKPQLVLMYGMSNINQLKKSALEFFQDVKFKMVKAEKQHIPQHHSAELDGTMLLITTQLPALRHNRIETGFDWQAFGRAARAKMSLP